MKVAIGLILGLAIGIACRLIEIPLPAPPALVGALLVLAMTLGYIFTDCIAAGRDARHRHLCGGPTGRSASHAEPVSGAPELRS